jgi:hypothetical protein
MVDGCVSQGSQDVPGVGVADSVMVFAKSRVANPVQPILDVPMVDPPSEQTRRVRPRSRDAGNGVGGFERLTAALFHASGEPADLSQTGPSYTSRKPRGGLQTIMGVPTVPFGGGVSRLAESLMLKLCVGGKIPTGIRRQSALSVPADCL